MWSTTGITGSQRERDRAHGKIGDPPESSRRLQHNGPRQLLGPSFSLNQRGVPGGAPLEPRALLFSGSVPYCDQKKIAEHLTARIDFFDFLHEGIAASLNMGLGVEDTVAAIQLPSELRESPYLRERYATLEFGIRGLHHRYSGWFDQNGSSLPLTQPADRAGSFVAAMGGPKTVLARALALRIGGNGPMALQYLDLLIDKGSLEFEARTQKAAILEQLGAGSRHGIERNMYRHLAKRELAKVEAARRPALDQPSRRRSIAGVVAHRP